MINTLFLVLAVLLGLASWTALVRGRSLGWLVPLWFLVSTAATELAPRVLATQIALALFGLVFLDLTATAVYSGLLILVLSMAAMLVVIKRHFEAGHVLERALATGLGDDFEQTIPLSRRHHLSRQIRASDWWHPITFARHGVRVERDISYGPHGERNLLDVYTPVTEGSGRPVLLQIHGGAWLMGHKAEQALPLLHHMAGLGWVVVSINYRLSPKATFPDHIIDVKRAIAWIRDNIDQWGGNADFMAVTGGSAGGHLASLAALSPNHAAWQPGFEQADTTLQAALPLYGAYDLCDRYEIRENTGIDNPVLSRVMKTDKLRDPELFDSASPITWVGPHAPPFFVVQGENDTLVWVEEARRFVAELSSVTQRELVYAELPGAQHSFETVHSPRTSHWLNAAALWLEWVYADWRERQASEPASRDETAS